MTYIWSTWACVLGLVIVCQDYQMSRAVGEFNLELHRINVDAQIHAHMCHTITQGMESLGEALGSGDSQLKRLRRN